MREIPLSQGKVALVDDEDYETVSRFKWCTIKGHNETIYAARYVRRADGTQTTVRMHRVIMKASASVQVDHENHDGLDNRRANLRLATSAENNRNTRMRKNNASGYKGVSWDQRANKWYAQIMANGRNIALGMFANIDDAADAYDEAARQLHGEFAHTNEMIAAQRMAS